MENQIKLVRGRIEEVTLAEPVVDVLVSEWMGYFLLFEGMLESVIHARNKYLSPSGIMLPNECSITMMAVGDSGELRILIFRGVHDNSLYYRTVCRSGQLLG